MDAEDAEKIDDKLKNMENVQAKLIEVEKDRLYAVTNTRKNIEKNLDNIFIEQNITRGDIERLTDDYKQQHLFHDKLEQDMRLTEILEVMHLELSAINRHQGETIFNYSIVTS